MNKNTLIATLAAVALAFTVATASAAEQNTVVAKAKLTQAQAAKIAQKKVANGTVNEGELEMENGILVWSFDISQPDSKNIVEIQVNAVTGNIVDVSIETPAAQAKEAAEDKKAEAPEKGEKGEKGEAKEKE